jgi:Domain of unknown function (DU1801)
VNADTEEGSMAELKTKPTTASVTDFLNSVDDEERRSDCFAVVKIMQQAAGAKPKMWGPSIVGFGDYRYTNSRGVGVDWFLIGFSPRKRDLTLYLMPGSARRAELLRALGKHKTGKACVYIKQLADVDRDVLRTLVEDSVEHLQARK